VKLKAKFAVVPALLALLAPAPSRAQSEAVSKGKAERPASAHDSNSATKLRIEVTGGEKDQPVEGASVYVKYVHEHKLAKDKKVEMNVKTNPEGVTKVPGVPRGKVLIQVVAEGWKPFGRWYDLDAEEQTIKIHLEKPPRWY